MADLDPFSATFALDPTWRKTGHRIATIQWQNGTMHSVAVGEPSPVD